MKPIRFENHFMERVMEITFPEGFVLEKDEDLKYLKNQWTRNISLWHSPYTCLFDLENVQISESQKQPFLKLLDFFKRFFMKDFIAYTPSNPFSDRIELKVFSSFDEALSKTRLGIEKKSREPTDLRSSIQIENDFQSHCMEISFLVDTTFKDSKDIDILSSKIKNILMMWHTPYSVLFNCVNCEFEEPAKLAFANLEKFLKAFFCKAIVGYAPKGKKETYPFAMVRSRHLAAGQVEHSGLTAGSVANCSSRKEKKDEV